ncbi:VWA domain-containing protein [Microvirga sp. VF16]|uniref:VWA domain-containing protein n=1 Tax=Microvirga sp. VF16 TaxID=2807101 RepID=UPI00193D5669|nr:VWA domain-containing protein [Microvirga sp. VF16]QRM36179.1 VWA domain-containing protein [Microvirga sp. VF16]
MADKKDLTRPPTAGTSPASMIDSFLMEAKRLGPLAGNAPRARLVFALDATMSRQPTWDLACRVQGEMFAATSEAGGLSVQLVYFRGFGECRASRWVADPRALTDLMTKIGCRGGQTQIGRVFRHVRTEASQTPLKVLVYVGDAMEEPIDDLCAVAGELGLLGIKAFMFHEGHDPDAARAFREIARLSGGAYAHFDAGAPQALSELLRAAAAYAAGGVEGLTRLTAGSPQARGLLTAITGGKP